jgi:hypothetical protein
LIHWLTFHYPHQSSTHPWCIYLKDRYRSKGKQIQTGDDVLFYELKGTLGTGRQAIVALAKVSGPMRENRFREGGPDERQECWPWEIPCSPAQQIGLISKKHVYGELGWPTSKPPLVPGGIMKLSDTQFDSLRKHSLVGELGTSDTFMSYEELIEMREKDKNRTYD